MLPEISQNDLHLKLGQLTTAWSALDYVLRLALKRLEGISMHAPKNQAEIDRLDEIFSSLTHGNLITDLKKALTKNPVSGLETLIDSIGSSRLGAGLYARRSQIIHALWAVTTEGQSFQQRIGGKDWKKPLQIKNADIDQLIKEIYQVLGDIDDLTRS